MIIVECAYYHIDNIGINKEGTCNKFPEKKNGVIRFLQCERIPISKCPYKLFCLGKIDKEELNKRSIKC